MDASWTSWGSATRRRRALSHADEDVIRGHGLPKGGRTLIDAERAEPPSAVSRRLLTR